MPPARRHLLMRTVCSITYYEGLNRRIAAEAGGLVSADLVLVSLSMLSAPTQHCLNLVTYLICSPQTLPIMLRFCTPTTRSASSVLSATASTAATGPVHRWWRFVATPPTRVCQCHRRPFPCCTSPTQQRLPCAALVLRHCAESKYCCWAPSSRWSACRTLG